MVKPREIETTQGIQQEVTVQDFDKMARRHVEKGYTDIKGLLQISESSSNGLEIGPGPGYMGLEWLKSTKDTVLTGLEISSEMIKAATKNAASYGVADRANYVQGNAVNPFPFDDNTFDIAFSFSSLHEWEKPENVFHELYRVLKPGGQLYVSDLRRDISFLFRFIMRSSTKERSMRKGFDTSLAAAYTVEEVKHIMSATKWQQFSVLPSPFGLIVKGTR